jgi:hypothetical protein
LRSDDGMISTGHLSTKLPASMSSKATTPAAMRQS